MPTYEYKCTSCEKEFEYQQRMSDAPKDVCEACGGKLERLISRTAFQLKGGGWYKDLYASPNPTKELVGKKPDKLEQKVTSVESKPASSDSGSSGGTSSGSSDSGGSS